MQKLYAIELMIKQATPPEADWGLLMLAVMTNAFYGSYALSHSHKKWD